MIGHANHFQTNTVTSLTSQKRGKGGVCCQGNLIMKNSLKSLFRGVPTISVHGQTDIVVERLVTDSRRVVPGAVFFAIGGLRTDGNLFVDEAVGRGAAVVISNEPYARTYAHITYIQVADVRRVLAEVAARFYDHPDRKLKIVGITGTNGKTTVASLSQFLLATKPGDVGMLGTIHYDLGQRTLPAYKTTPESVDIYSMLQQMNDSGCSACAMEVSSHAIDQLRVEGLDIDVAVFLNLTQDHMDYHKTMEEYFSVKRRLFTGETGHKAPSVVVNVDDSYGSIIANTLEQDRKIVTFGQHSGAMVRAENVVLELRGSSFDVVWPEGHGHVKSNLPGHYNVSNVLAALAVVYASGGDLQSSLKKVSEFRGVQGRMESVDTGQAFQVLVDYAHTDDALINALGMLRPITPGKLYVVFGCGGDRDRTKRPKMVAAVQRFADFAWATSDNPRKEPLEQIFADMQSGIENHDTIEFIQDRRVAIGRALDSAGRGDCVLIAGKGHEVFQEYANMVVPFDDRQVAREWLMMKTHSQQ